MMYDYIITVYALKTPLEYVICYISHDSKVQREHNILYATTTWLYSL